MLEFDRSSHPFRTDLIYDSIRMVDGSSQIPSTPGIGVDVNREVIDAYRIN